MSIKIKSMDNEAKQETKLQRYKRLKSLIINRVRISREDFLFVKAIDQRSNNRKAIRLGIRNRRNPDPMTVRGFNTCTR